MLQLLLLSSINDETGKIIVCQKLDRTNLWSFVSVKARKKNVWPIVGTDHFKPGLKQCQNTSLDKYMTFSFKVKGSCELNSLPTKDESTSFNLHTL